MAAEYSLKPRFFFFLYSKSSSGSSGQPPPSVLFYSYFFSTLFFSSQSCWRGWFGLFHSSQRLCSLPQAKEHYPPPGSSSGTVIITTFSIAVAVAVTVDILGTSSVVLLISVVWTVQKFRRWWFAFVPRWSFFLAVFSILEHSVFTVVDTVILPVVLTTFIVFVNGGDVFYWS